MKPASAGLPRLLRDGAILAVKGLGGYHLACDARNPAAVAALRDRKYRKEKAFRPDGAGCRDGPHAWSSFLLKRKRCSLLSPVPSCSRLRKSNSCGVAPDNNELGVMLPYTPLHHLLFAAGAPEILVMTSANRSSEPIAYEDEDALQRLAGIADSFLIGQRPIARRVDDSVARAGAFGPVVLRRARGYAPGAVASLPAERPILALGADLKNTHHPGRGGPGLRQPAYRRPGPLPVAPRISRDHRRSGLDVRSSPGRNAVGARSSSAIFLNGPRRDARRCAAPQTAQCSIIAPTWHPCSPSAESGRNES